MKNNLYKLIFIILLPLLLNTSLADNHKKIKQNNPIPVSNIFMQANNINTVFRSDGIFNYDKVTFAQTEAGLIWPVTSPQRLTMDFASGIWIAAKVGTQRELRIASCFYNSLFTPGNIPVQGQVPPQSVCNDASFKGYHVNLTNSAFVNGGTVTVMAGGISYQIQYDAWSSWPIDKGAPYVEINGIPGYQPGWGSDRPGIGETTARPDEISFMVYMDYTNCTNNIHANEIDLPGGTLPMGAEIQQISFAFSAPDLTNMYFMKWKIFNKSTNIWDSTYFTIVDDPDIGDNIDDAVGCDTIRQTGFAYNFSNHDNVYGTAPPALGYRMLQSPLKYTGNPNDTAKVLCGIQIGYKPVGMTVYNTLFNTNDPCIGDPYDAISGYNYMRGFDNCGRPIVNYITGRQTTYKFTGNACAHTGWYDSLSGDKRQFISSGPFAMNPGDQQTLLEAIVIGRSSTNYQSVCSMLALSDSAKKYYDQCFFGIPIGIRNISTEVPGRYELFQNYPNPFNPSTKIKYQIVSNKFVSLKVYDILGKEIAVLVNQKQNAGKYEVDFNGNDLPSGVYFYTITTDDFTKSNKMVLIK